MTGGIGIGDIVLGLAAGAAAWLVLSALLGKKRGQREFLREKPLRMETPFPMYGKPDLVREESDGTRLPVATQTPAATAVDFFNPAASSVTVGYG